ncbi:MAG: hypothetical protein KDC80_16070 [Saprospiraceae bacterium]|nr:hypothetical protein [Saprospiraceae bacterium]
MKEIPAYIDLPSPLQNCIKYVWIVFCQHYDLKPTFNTKREGLKISLSEDADLQVSRKFSSIIRNKRFKHKNVFPNQPLLLCENGKPDYLGTCFYLLNYLQEYNDPDLVTDEYGRFPFKASYQAKFENVESDLVSDYFRKIAESISAGFIKDRKTASRVFLSHDVDTITSSLLHEGKAALVQKDFPLVMQVILKHILEGPSYLNQMDRIMDIHDKQGFKSTFFWLVERGRRKSPYTNKPVPHSDYRIQKKRIIKKQYKILRRGFENGLHKSVMKKPFNEELDRIDLPVIGNRNHYLFVRLPHHFNAVEKSDILLDFSLGFGRMYGHRNSYGRPIIPFNMSKYKAYSFLEVPLQIMDTTFKFYHKLPAKKAEKSIIDFLENHRYNSLISILWHNDMFSPIKNPGWLRLYKTILDYLRQNKIRSITQKELLEEREKQLTSFRSNFL